MKSLSILLPTYNCLCVQLVKTLHSQCEAVEGLRYEIIVADDGSTDKDLVEQNKQILQLNKKVAEANNTLTNTNDTLTNITDKVTEISDMVMSVNNTVTEPNQVVYIIRTKNVGRSRIRNFLVCQAHYDWVLFIDGDRQLGSDRFIQDYLDCKAEAVACGGLRVGGDEASLKDNLRYMVEKRYESHNDAVHRQRQPYRHFNTSNFLVRRNILLEHPFDERFVRYGYEDVMWGKMLRENAIPILHLDNPILIDDYESNAEFIAKTEEGMHTLTQFADELEDYSGVIQTWHRLRRLRLCFLARWFYRCFGRTLKKRLTDNKPSVFWFNLYKLTLYTSIQR